jgi:uncharacterized membrane protein YGL010W
MTRSIKHELAIYDSIHRSPGNRLIHAVGIPVIMFSVGGFGTLIGQTDGVFNVGMLLGLIVGIVIGRYDLKCGIALTLFSWVLTFAAQLIHAKVGTVNAAIIYAVAFVIGWIVQFIGHAIERAGPAFGSRPLNLLLGPISVINDFLPLVRPAPWREADTQRAKP